MIDIHSHILAGLDDGAETLEEGVAMVRIAAEAGTTDIVATPHANLDYEYDPETADRKIAELAGACGVSIRIHRGCDFHLHYDNIQKALENPARYAVNGKRYILVEFPELMVSRATAEVMRRLRLAGLIPIVTHPERNMLLQQRLDDLRRWVGEGCCLQVTAQSLLGDFGGKAKAFSEKLIREGLAHFLASDAHDPVHRPPRLDRAYRYVANKFGPALAERLCVSNPRAVIEGEPIEAIEVEIPAPLRRWWRIGG